MTLAHHHLPAPTPRPDTPPILLLHGFTSSADADFLGTGWVEALHEAGRSVIAVDLPGHGRSAAISAAEQATTSGVLRAIADTVTAVSPSGPIDVIGYSLGGRLAWDLPQHSDRVRRLVLGGVSPFEPFSAVDPAALAEALGGTPAENPLVGMMAAMISAPGQDTASLARLIPGLASEPFTPATSAPPHPTLLVAGEADPMTEGIAELAALLRGGTLRRVPGDHRGALDSAEFRAAAIEFLAG
ncbi:alpha/beta fold hydrolase [Leucobacter chromiireducens]|uniref:Alpha/beta fold hydrolase n=1 Tax=Leucobacter chromiireducens subsp. solipictus TaxID=398235 RepID=A0ABS1SHH6_9MICO|nr:alpha/beta fold hydrolase [Leucobacter chromiireducens]MBL3680022.1 alpha/beta fold hydrolase [Leucobacter chromiireducens subsp. solipictus]